MSREPAGWDVDSPVQAEVFVVWLDGDRLQLTGPDGPQPWILQLGATEHPVEVVDRIVRDVVGPPILVHSTSWRRDRDAVILSFVVVIDSSLVGTMTSLPIERAELARSEATVAPRDIAVSAVVEHGLRHLAWLVQDDPVVAAELPAPWRPLLAAYVPEPFRSLGCRRAIAMDDPNRFTNRCACGWEVTGSEDEVVDATIDHGRRIHNMEATREQVLVALHEGATASDPVNEAAAG